MGPSDFWMKEAEMLCGPALTWMGGVFMPSLASVIRGVDVDDGDARAVDGDFDLLAFALILSEEGAGGGVVEADLENVFAIGGEIVDDGDAAARSERRAFDVARLRGDARNGVSWR